MGALYSRLTSKIRNCSGRVHTQRVYWRPNSDERHNIIEEVACLAKEFDASLCTFHKTIATFDDYHTEGCYTGYGKGGESTGRQKEVDLREEMVRMFVSLYVAQDCTKWQRDIAYVMAVIRLSAICQDGSTGDEASLVSDKKMVGEMIKDMRLRVKETMHTPTLLDLVERLAVTTESGGKSLNIARLLATSIACEGLQCCGMKDVCVASTCLAIGRSMENVAPWSSFCETATGVSCVDIREHLPIVYDAAITVPLKRPQMTTFPDPQVGWFYQEMLYTEANKKTVTVVYDKKDTLDTSDGTDRSVHLMAYTYGGIWLLESVRCDVRPMDELMSLL